MCDDCQPYVVPLSFGYDGCFLYFHTAREGRKIDIIKRNNQVCFEFDILHDIITSEQTCNWGAKYESVIGSGTAEILDTLEAKNDALEWIMRQYGNGNWDFTEKMLNKTLVLRVQIIETSDEPRFLVIGNISGKYWSGVITYRSEKIRIVSVRRSRKEEVDIYESS